MLLGTYRISVNRAEYDMHGCQVNNNIWVEVGQGSICSIKA